MNNISLKDIADKYNLSAILFTNIYTIYYLFDIRINDEITYTEMPLYAIYSTYDDKYTIYVSSLEYGYIKSLFPDNDNIISFKRNNIFGALEEISLQLSGKVGYESMSINSYYKDIVDDKLQNCSLYPVDDILNRLRIVKKDNELNYIQSSYSIAERALYDTINNIKVGEDTERDIANKLNYNMLLRGSEKHAFPTIVSYRENSATPHHMPTNRTIDGDGALCIDFGATYNGYRSDITRTFYLAKKEKDVSASFMKIYRIVHEAQMLGIKMFRQGMTFSALDNIVREYINKAGYGDYYIHGLGHGIGLETHELPFIVNNEIKLIENIPFTIEPGIYIDGKFGVRIEDGVYYNKSLIVMSKFQKMNPILIY